MHVIFPSIHPSSIHHSTFIYLHPSIHPSIIHNLSIHPSIHPPPQKTPIFHSDRTSQRPRVDDTVHQPDVTCTWRSPAWAQTAARRFLTVSRQRVNHQKRRQDICTSGPGVGMMGDIEDGGCAQQKLSMGKRHVRARLPKMHLSVFKKCSIALAWQMQVSMSLCWLAFSLSWLFSSFYSQTFG